MDGWVPKGGSVPPAADGAFERFLTAAIAAIITIMFSWRLLDEMGSDVDREGGDGGEEAARKKRAAAYVAIASSRPLSASHAGPGQPRQISELDIDGDTCGAAGDSRLLIGAGDKAGPGGPYNVSADSRSAYPSLTSWGSQSNDSGFQSLPRLSNYNNNNNSIDDDSSSSVDEVNSADLMKRFTSAPPTYLPAAWSPLHPDAFARRPGVSTFQSPPAKPARNSDLSQPSRMDTQDILRRREAAYENRDTWSSPDNSRGEMSDDADDDEEMIERRGVMSVDDNGTTCFDWPSEDGSGGQDTTGGEDEFVNVSGDSGEDHGRQEPRELDSDEELYCCSLLEPIIEEDSDDFLSSSGEDSLKNAAAQHVRHKHNPHHHPHHHPQPARPPPPLPPDDEENSSPSPPALPSRPPPPLKHFSVDDEGDVKTPTQQKEFCLPPPVAMANHPSPMEVVEDVFKTESPLIPDTTVDSSDGQSLPYVDDESESDESVQTVVRRGGSAGSRSSASSVSSSLSGSLESSPLHVPRFSTAQQQQQQQYPPSADMYGNVGLGTGVDSERVREAFGSSMERLMTRVKQGNVSALLSRAGDNNVAQDDRRDFPEESSDVQHRPRERVGERNERDSERGGRIIDQDSTSSSDEETFEETTVYNIPETTFPRQAHGGAEETQGIGNEVRPCDTVSLQVAPLSTLPPQPSSPPQAHDAVAQNPFRAGMIIDQSPSVTVPAAQEGRERETGSGTNSGDIDSRYQLLPLPGSSVNSSKVDSVTSRDSSDTADTDSGTDSSGAENDAHADEKANSDREETDEDERDTDSAPAGKSKIPDSIASFLTEFEDEPFARKFRRTDRSPDRSFESEPYARRAGRRDRSPEQESDSNYDREPYARRIGRRDRSPDRSPEYEREPYARRPGQKDRSPEYETEPYGRGPGQRDRSPEYEREPYAKRPGQRDRSPEYEREPYARRPGQRDRSPEYEREPYARRPGQRDRSPEYETEPYAKRPGQRDRSPEYETEPYGRRPGQRDRSPEYESEPYAKRPGQRDRSPEYETEPYGRRPGQRDRSPEYESEPYAKRPGQRDRSPEYESKPYARRSGQRDRSPDRSSEYEREPYARRASPKDRSPEAGFDGRHESEPYTRWKDRRERSREPEVERKHADSVHTQPHSDTRISSNTDTNTRPNTDREPVRSVTAPSRAEPLLTELEEEPFSRRLGSSRGTRLVEANKPNLSPPIIKIDEFDSDEEKLPQKPDSQVTETNLDESTPESSDSESKSDSEEDDHSSDEDEQSVPEEKSEVIETVPKKEELKKMDPFFAEFEEEPFARRRAGSGRVSAPRETNLDDELPRPSSDIVSPAKRDQYFDQNRPSLPVKKVDPLLDELEEEPFGRRIGSRGSDRASIRSDSDFDRSARSSELGRHDTDFSKKGADLDRSVSNKSDTNSIDSFLTELDEEPFARRIGRRRRSPDRAEPPARPAPPRPVPPASVDIRKDTRDFVESPTVSKPVFASSPPPVDLGPITVTMPESPSVSLPPSRGYVTSTPQKPRQEDAVSYSPVSESPTISLPPVIEAGPEAILCYSSSVSVTFTGSEGIRPTGQGEVTSGAFADATESNALEEMPRSYTISRCVSETSRSERRIFLVDKPMYPDFETLINSVPYTSEAITGDQVDKGEPDEDLDDYSAFVQDLRRPTSGSDLDVIPTPRAALPASAAPPATDAQILSGNLVSPPETDVFAFPPAHPNILPAVSSVSKDMGPFYSDPDSQADREDKSSKAEGSSEGVLDTSFDIDSTSAREKMDEDFDFLTKGPPLPAAPLPVDYARRMVDDDDRMSSDDKYDEADDEYSRENETRNGERRRRRRKDDSGDRVNDRKRRRNNRRNRRDDESDEDLSDSRTDQAGDRTREPRGRQGRFPDRKQSPRGQTKDAAQKYRTPVTETTNTTYDRKHTPEDTRGSRPAGDFRFSEQASDVMTKTDPTASVTPTSTATVDEGPPILFFQPAALIHASPPATYSEPMITKPAKPPGSQKEQYQPGSGLSSSAPQAKDCSADRRDRREDREGPGSKFDREPAGGQFRLDASPQAVFVPKEPERSPFAQKPPREDQKNEGPGSTFDREHAGGQFRLEASPQAVFVPREPERSPFAQKPPREDQKNEGAGSKLDTERIGGEFRLEPSPPAVFVSKAPESSPLTQKPPLPKPRHSSLTRPTPMPRSKSLGDNISSPTTQETAIDIDSDDEDVFQRGRSLSQSFHSSLEDDEDGEAELMFTKKKSAPLQLSEQKRPRSLKEIRRSMQKPNARPMIAPFTLPDNMVLPSRLKIMASRKSFLSSDNLDSKGVSPTFQEQFAAHKLAQGQTSTPAKERMYKSPNRRIRAYSTSQDQLEKLHYMLNYSRQSESSFERGPVDHLHADCILTPQGRRNILDKTLSIENLQVDLPQHLRRFGSVTSLVETNLDTGETQETNFFPETNLDIFDSLFQQLHQPLQRSASMSDMVVSDPGAQGAQGQGHDDSSLDRSFHGLRMSLPPSQTHKSTGKGRFAHRKYQQKSKSLCTLETNLDDVGEEGGGGVSVDGEMKRVPSVHELRVTKSLQKLNLPDWYRQSSLSKSSSCLLKYGSNSTMNSFSFSPSLLSSPCASTAPPAPNVVIKTRVVPPTNPRLLRSSPGGTLSPTAGPGGFGGGGSYADRKSGQSPVKLPSDKLRDKEKNKNLMPIPIVPFSQIRAMFEKKDKHHREGRVKGRPHDHDSRATEPASSSSSSRATVTTDNKPKEEGVTKHGILKTSAVPSISISAEGDPGRGAEEPRHVRKTLFNVQQQPSAEAVPAVVVDDFHTPTVSVPAHAQPRTVQQQPPAHNMHGATNGVRGDDSVDSRTVPSAGDVKSVSPVAQESRTPSTSAFAPVEKRPQPPATLGSSADKNLRTPKDQKSPATSKDPKQQFSPTRSLRQFFGGGKSKDKSGSGDSKKGDSSSGGGESLDSSFSSGDGVYEREPRRLGVSDLSRRFDATPKTGVEDASSAFDRRSGAGSGSGGRPGDSSFASSEEGVSPTRTESAPWTGHAKPQSSSAFPASVSSRSPHHPSSTSSGMRQPGFINYTRQSSTEDQPPFVRLHEEPRASSFRQPEPSEPADSGSRFGPVDVREPSAFQRRIPGAGTSFDRPRSTAENGDHDGEPARPGSASGGGVKAASDKKPLQETTV